MCCGRFMKGLVEIIRELDHSSIRSSVQGIIGRPSKLMPRRMSRSAMNVNDSATSIDNPRSTLPQ